MTETAVNPEAVVARTKTTHMSNTLLIVPAEARHGEAVKEMLRNEKLPVSDLPADLKNFYIATDNGSVIGSIGLETYDEFGFLRSLVVKPEYRTRKIAGELVKKLEEHAQQAGLGAIYLLTETASAYFQQKGFTIIKRDEMPSVLQQSSEFTHTCPQSAIAMFKPIG